MWSVNTKYTYRYIGLSSPEIKDIFGVFYNPQGMNLKQLLSLPLLFQIPRITY